ncbi:MAG: 50S ribosomal protein L21 [Bauldia sp.]|nr:50S ribosomal protein L21 [Bauldia sp.]
MFAVIKAGGRQYRVAADDVIEIDRIGDDVGESVSFGEVLMIGGPDGTRLGAPLIEGATVAGEVVEHRRAAKIIVFKKRRRKNERRTRGHRQHLTLVRITDILTDGARPKAKATETKPAKKAEKAETAEAAPAPSADDAPAGEALFATPAGAADDLKKIAGIGPVLEGKLNALGITRFDQIAAFTAEDTAKIDDALHFKGRVEREDWIGQAKALAAEDKGA